MNFYTIIRLQRSKKKQTKNKQERRKKKKNKEMAMKVGLLEKDRRIDRKQSRKPAPIVEPKTAQTRRVDAYHKNRE